ncbi:MAG: KamA family radical SAM protein [Desulfonatronovibrionaceae bacterium]
MQYKSYTVKNFRKIPQLERLNEEVKRDIEIVARVLPFKVNNFVLDHLINWDSVPNDPIFVLTFPQKEMLLPEHYQEIAELVQRGADEQAINKAANRIRLSLNPHPAGQLEYNVPHFRGEYLTGVQHKYRQTALYFPRQGQTCHAYCTFCFRWPQFVGMSKLHFAAREVDMLIEYLRENPQITDLLLTGGDPMVMSANRLAEIIDPVLKAKLPYLRRIRIGTKSLAYWPFRFLTDKDSGDLLRLLERVTDSGMHLAVMAHFVHPNEFASEHVRRALHKVHDTGAEIRTQSPVLRNINDDSEAWKRLWDIQVDHGCVPYYMFIARNTGAGHYFNIPLVRAWEIFREAYQKTSGLCRTVRGPVMSTNPGKIQILGVTEIQGQKVYQLRFLQGRNPDWVHRPFFAEFDPSATWINHLKPAFGEEQFFFESELEQTLQAAESDDGPF